MKHISTPFTKQSLTVVTAVSLLAGSTLAHSADTFTEALTGGKASVNLQLRYEGVDQVGKLDADATTVRARLGYETATFNGFGAMLEAEHVTALGDSYDSKANGKTQFAAVVDPESTEINQAYLSYGGLPDTVVKWGRQRLILDNARFVGNVGWRQNEQTFDAFTVVNKSLPDTVITAGYITNANRIFSDDAVATTGAAAGNHKMGSTILNASYKGWSLASITGYAYLLDYDTATAFTANTTDTYGIRLNGSAPMGGNKLLYTAEYARQSDGSNNTVDFKTNYMLLEGGIDVTGVAVFKLGYEVLGSDTGAITKATGAAAANKPFSTPLATLHAFNGWADMFLVTPTNGLKDTYVSANTKLAGFNLGAVYHDYAADTGATTDLGNELNLVATYAFDKNYTVGLKYADYSAGDLLPATYPDTKKTWLWGEFKF
ncbi:MAG: hypothetical protein A2Z95_04845 [Gallionellales bacterium GWA2_60_18]|nr:MAG: hypothetical protein A2Z95_04845 [Gallionellales bacterium GWA2_60_18]